MTSPDLIGEILCSAGVDQFDVSQVSGVLDGYIIADLSSGRQSIEALLNIFQIDVFEDAGTIIFRSPGVDPVKSLSRDDLDHSLAEPVIAISQEQESDVPVSVHIRHLDPEIQFQETETEAARVDRSGIRKQIISLPAVSDRGRIEGLAEDWIRNRWSQRETISLGLSRQNAALNVGDLISLEEDSTSKLWKISRVDIASGISVLANSYEQGELRSSLSDISPQRFQSPINSGSPQITFLDLPLLNVGGFPGGNTVAAVTTPWPGEMALYSSASDTGYTYRQSLENAAFVGELLEELPGSSITSRWSSEHNPKITLLNGILSSVEEIHVLNGANGLALQKPNGRWEILQFAEAQLTGNQTWSLQNLLRGQAGTEAEAATNSIAGSRVVILNSAVSPLNHTTSERGLLLNWLAGPAGKTLGGPAFAVEPFAPGYRSLEPLSPVHLDVNLGENQSIAANWIRRDRSDADDWRVHEIQMSEDSEIYAVKILHENELVYASQTTQPSITIPSTSLTDLTGEAVKFSVAQVSAAVGEGLAATQLLQL